MNHRVKLFLRFGVSVVLLGLLLWWVDLESVWDVVRRLDSAVFGLALAVAMADRFVMFAKWRPLLKAVGVHASFWLVARLYWAVSFASMFLPSSVGADLLRVFVLGRLTGRGSAVFASVVMERVLGVAATIVMIAAATLILLLAQVQTVLPPATLWGALGVAVLTLVPFHPGLAGRIGQHVSGWFSGRIGSRLDQVLTAYGRYSQQKLLLWGVGVATLLEQVFPVVAVYLITVSLGIDIPFISILFVIPVVMFFGRLPLSISGIGLDEGLIVVLLTSFGLEAPEALAIGLGRRLLIWLAAAPGALFWHELKGAFSQAEAGSRNGNTMVKAEA